MTLRAEPGAGAPGAGVPGTSVSEAGALGAGAALLCITASTAGNRPATALIVAMLHLMSRPVAITADGPGPAANGVQRIQAVDRAIALLKAVAASTTPPTVLELARRCGINRATPWRLLRMLEHHGSSIGTWSPSGTPSVTAPQWSHRR